MRYYSTKGGWQTNTDLSTWELVGEDHLNGSRLADHELILSCKPLQFQYVAQSQPMKYPVGFYLLKYDVKLEHGGISFGILQEGGGWIFQQNNIESGRYDYSLYLLNPGKQLRITVAACNQGDGLALEACISNLTFELLQSGLFAHIAILKKELKKRFNAYYREKCIPKRNMARLARMKKHGERIIAKSGGKGNRYCLVDFASGGYAVRGMCVAKIQGQPYLITADAGDDTLSFFKVTKGKLSDRKTVKVPCRNSPFHLAKIGTAGDTDRILACLFNFGGGAREQRSYLLDMDNPSSLLDTGQIENPEEDANPLIISKGICGIRGVDAWRDGAGKYIIGVVDRDPSRFHLIRGVLAEGPLKPTEYYSLDLVPNAEPIGVGRYSPCETPHSPLYYLSLRGREEVLVVRCLQGDKPELFQRMELSGLSRTSVALGNLRHKDRTQMALATWGGDPKDLNSEVRGKVVIADLDKQGSITDFIEIEGGVHPTDVVIADFDGDGIDELALLNYGCGLGPLDRSHMGGVEIFKWKDGVYCKIASIDLPNPRKGAALDIDGDGRVELVVSLFFERCMAVIKVV